MTSEVARSVAASPDARRAGTLAAGPGDPGAPLNGRASAVEQLSIEVAPHNCFACGSLNEHGLHLDLHVDAGRCWTDLALDSRFQGWDGIAHGGIVCTLLDEVMAWSLAASDNWGVTARMAVAFRRPVEIGRAIRAEGWIGEARRRVVATRGQVIDLESGDVLATAEGTYVAADDARKAQLQARYAFRLLPATEGTPR